MWSSWTELYGAMVMADIPHEGLAPGLAGIEMLFATDLQWDRFRDAVASSRETDQPPQLPARWIVEAHFFLVAADNASDRLTVWARMIDDQELTHLIGRLEDENVKTFRHHQEHLEERMPGGKHEDRARLTAPGNRIIKVNGGSSVLAMNNLLDERVLTFGDAEVDLAATHSTMREVSAELLRWLEDRSRFRRPSTDSWQSPSG